MNNSYTYDPNFSYQKSHLNPNIDQSITTYGIA